MQSKFSQNNFEQGFSLLLILLTSLIILLSGIWAYIIYSYKAKPVPTNEKVSVNKIVNNATSSPTPTPECQTSEKLTPLFSDIQLNPQPSIRPNNRALRSRLVRINMAAFNIEATDSGKLIPKAKKILLNPFPGICAIAELKKAHPFQQIVPNDPLTSATWIGHVSSEDVLFTLIIEPEEILNGYFHIGKDRFWIDTSKEGHILRQKDLSIPDPLD